MEIQPNNIYNMDCLEGMKYIKDKSIDCIICDLPYGTTQNKWDSIIPFDKLWAEYNRVIKDDGAIILFGQGIFTAELMLSNKKCWRYNLIWKKGNRTSGFLNANRMPLRNHEDICIFYKKLPTYNPQFEEGIPLHGKGTAYKTKQNVNNNYGSFEQLDDTRKGSTQKYPKSVLIFDKPHPAIHPTQKPVALIEYLIKTYTNENAIILDNCMGSGTTAIACINTNRQYIGFELEKEYYDLSLKRIREVDCNE